MENSRAWTVLLAGGHGTPIRRFRGLVDGHADFSVIATSSDGKAALAAIRDRQPDLAVLDLDTPGLEMLDVLGIAIDGQSPTRVVLLSSSLEDGRLMEAIVHGVHGILLKETAPEHLIDCLQQVAEGRRYLAPRLMQVALQQPKRRRTEQNRLAANLTAREAEIVGMVAEGLTNKRIARQLSITEGTVKIHLHKIFRTVGVANRTALAMLSHKLLGKSE